MRLRRRFLFLILFFLIPLSSCSNQDDNLPRKEPVSIEAASDSVECTNPRPGICTREYMPVCGTRDTDVRCITTPCPSTELKTYSNKCEACADEKVLSYILGKCE